LHETPALLSVEPDRVGHGTFLIPELAGGSELANAILAKKTPIGTSTSFVLIHTLHCWINCSLWIQLTWKSTEI